MERARFERDYGCLKQPPGPVLKMTSKPVVILGGVGSGVIVAQGINDIAAAGGDLRILGFLNDVVPVGSLIEGLPAFGKFEDWRTLPEETLFITAVHKPKEMLRLHIFSLQLDLLFPKLTFHFSFCGRWTMRSHST